MGTTWARHVVLHRWDPAVLRAAQRLLTLQAGLARQPTSVSSVRQSAGVFLVAEQLPQPGTLLSGNLSRGGLRDGLRPPVDGAKQPFRRAPGRSTATTPRRPRPGPDTCPRPAGKGSPAGSDRSRSASIRPWSSGRTLSRTRLDARAETGVRLPSAPHPAHTPPRPPARTAHHPAQSDTLTTRPGSMALRRTLPSQQHQAADSPSWPSL